MRLEDQAGVITGAGSGIGHAAALLFAQEGAALVLAGRNEARLQAVADEIAAAGGRALVSVCDVALEADVERTIALCADELGGIDFLVNNAGGQLEKPLHETSVDEWDDIFATNVRGVFLGTKHAVIAMLAQGRGGAIVNTASALSLVADPVLPAYTASKHAVLGLTRSTGIAYAADGIRCNCICPGDIETPLVQQYLASMADPAAARLEIEGAYPGKRMGQPIEAAQALLFLASRESSFVNASSIEVDGGILAKFY
jgi:NAD(P)-dependent dehydrogenase (short-subunit alcohol dehydrogenase family)